MQYFDYPEGNNEGLSKKKLSQTLFSFEDISIHDWKKLFDYAQVIDFVADQPLMVQGRRDKNIYIILKGEIILLKSHSLLTEVMVASLKAGDVFGEEAFFNNDQRGQTAKATTTGKCLRFNYENYLQLLGDNPILAHKFFVNIADTFAKKNTYKQLYLHNG